MKAKHGWMWALGSLTLGALMLSGLAIRAESASGNPVTSGASRQDWNTFAADFTIKRAHVGGTGDVIARTPRVRYHWERALTTTGWKTTLTLEAIDRPTVHTPTGERTIPNPFHVVRLEQDDEGSRPRMYDQLNRLVEPPSRQEVEALTTRAREEHPDLAAMLNPAPAARTPGGRKDTSVTRAWVEHVLPTPEGGPGRRRQVEARFGAPVGNVRGLTRYLKVQDGTTYELLLDPALSIPSEFNVVRAGRLQTATVLSYLRGPSGGAALSTVHVEQSLGEGDQRGVTDIEYTNLRLENRR